MPGLLRRGVVAPVVRRLPPSYHKVGFDYMARRFVEGAELEPDAAHYWWRVLFTDDERQRILAPETRRLLGDHAPFDDYLAAAPKRDEFAGNDRFLYLDLSTYLPNDILVKVDRTSMGNSLEARAPFLDRRVVEFLLSVPPSLKLRGLTRKYLLRRATQKILPKHIHRPAQARLQRPGRRVVPRHARRNPPRYGPGAAAPVVRCPGGARDGR